MNTIINLDTYLKEIKSHIIDLENVHKVAVLGSSFSAEDIDKLSHQTGVANVLITAAGGGVERKGNQQWNTCTFGIYVLCSKDNNAETIGYSADAIEITQQILSEVSLNQFGKKHAGAVSIPNITEFSALSSQDFEKKGFVVWYCIFNQKLRIA